MKVLAIYGNPKDDGLVHGCMDVIVARLRGRGVEVEPVRLKDEGILDCAGCFRCLRTGTCPLPDGMNDLAERMRGVDGLVLGCSVRNGTVTALYKRFCERITYPLEFTGDMEGKYVLSVAAVGMMGGRNQTRNRLGLETMGTYHVDHLFFRAGMPTRLTAESQRERLEKAADELMERYESNWRPGLLWRLGRWFDRMVMTRLVFSKNPAFFAHAIRRYQARGWMK